MKDAFYKLTLVTRKQATPISQYLAFIESCVKAGVTAIQLREKNLAFDELLKFGQQLKTILKPYSVPLIINDNVELAYQLNVEGVHLGQTDGDILAARQKLGKDKIIGLTVDNIEQLHRANLLPVDYIGIGAVFPTQNKSNISTVWGCEGLAQIASLSKHRIIAIGGIDQTNAAQVMQAGAHGIAAIGAFHEAADLKFITQYLRKIIDNNKLERVDHA